MRRSAASTSRWSVTSRTSASWPRGCCARAARSSSRRAASAASSSTARCRTVPARSVAAAAARLRKIASELTRADRRHQPAVGTRTDYDNQCQRARGARARRLGALTASMRDGAVPTTAAGDARRFAQEALAPGTISSSRGAATARSTKWRRRSCAHRRAPRHRSGRLRQRSRRAISTIPFDPRAGAAGCRDRPHDGDRRRAGRTTPLLQHRGHRHRRGDCRRFAERGLRKRGPLGYLRLEQLRVAALSRQDATRSPWTATVHRATGDARRASPTAGNTATAC